MISSLNLLHIYDHELRVRPVSMGPCFPSSMLTGKGAGVHWIKVGFLQG